MKAEVSRRAHEQKVSYLLGLFKPPGDFSAIGFLAGLNSYGLALRLPDLAILSPQRPLTRLISTAVGHFADMCLRECTLHDWDKGHRQGG